MGNDYWNCSVFADWLRGTPKPLAASVPEWQEWQIQAKAAHPIRYWIVEEGLDQLQYFVKWPLRKLKSVRSYANNRWISRSYALTAHPRDIPRGEWRDVGSRFLPCLFNELVDFVEVEQAWHNVCWDNEAAAKFNMPWARRVGLRGWRCPEAGLDYLDWASRLVQNEDMGVEKNDINYGHPTRQALVAIEIKELYVWWTQVYRNRPDPYDTSGWMAYYSSFQEKYGTMFHNKDENELKEWLSILEECERIEKQYKNEDTQMLIRLVKIRDSLWT